MQAGTAPKPIRVRHILSTAIWQSPVQVALVLAPSSEPLKPRVTKSMTKAAQSWPRPCMAKTAAIMAPLHLVVANLEATRSASVYLVCKGGDLSWAAKDLLGSDN